MTQLVKYVSLETIEVGTSGYPTGQQGSYSNSPPASRIFHKFVSKPNCVTLYYLRLWSRSCQRGRRWRRCCRECCRRCWAAPRLAASPRPTRPRCPAASRPPVPPPRRPTRCWAAGPRCRRPRCPRARPGRRGCPRGPACSARSTAPCFRDLRRRLVFLPTRVSVRGAGGGMAEMFRLDSWILCSCSLLTHRQFGQPR